MMNKQRIKTQTTDQRLKNSPEVHQKNFSNNGQREYKKMTRQMREGTNRGASKQKSKPVIDESEDDVPIKSELGEIEEFITQMMKKQKKQELSSTDKFMLRGFIDIYIQEKFLNKRAFSKLSSTKQIHKQWKMVIQAWQLYKIKITKCIIGGRNVVRENKVSELFKATKKEYEIFKQTNEKPDNIRKIFKNLCINLLDGNGQ